MVFKKGDKVKKKIQPSIITTVIGIDLLTGEQIIQTEKWGWDYAHNYISASSCKNNCCEDGNRKDCPFKEEV